MDEDQVKKLGRELCIYIISTETCMCDDDGTGCILCVAEQLIIELEN